MTIDEAIAHAEWCADNSCGECADEHRQLAEWLRELKDLRRKREILKAHGVEIVDAVAGGYEVYNELQRTVYKVKGENERLKELCVEMWAVIFKNNTWWDWNNGDTKRFARLLLEMGVQLDGAANSTARLLREWGIEVDDGR